MARPGLSCQYSTLYFIKHPELRYSKLDQSSALLVSHIKNCLGFYIKNLDIDPIKWGYIAYPIFSVIANADLFSHSINIYLTCPCLYLLALYRNVNTHNKRTVYQTNYNRLGIWRIRTVLQSNSINGSLTQGNVETHYDLLTRLPMIVRTCTRVIAIIHLLSFIRYSDQQLLI